MTRMLALLVLLVAAPAPAADSCCVVGTGPGCDDAVCQAAICAFDPYCCTGTWDFQCSQEAQGLYTVLGTYTCACATVPTATPTVVVPTSTPTPCGCPEGYSCVPCGP